MSCLFLAPRDAKATLESRVANGPVGKVRVTSFGIMLKSNDSNLQGSHVKRRHFRCQEIIIKIVSLHFCRMHHC